MRETSKIFDIDWNLVVNLGIKCNTLGISRSAEVRYYSSPFDNMDTVEGLVETADLMSTGFANYFDDIKDWEIKNEVAPRSTEIRNKIVWHKNTPNVYYPHFADVWFKENMSKDELHDWKLGEDLTIEPIWEDMKRVFGNRQQRLVSQLRSNNKILFFRADEKRQLKRVHSTNQDQHLEEFITKMQTAFPQTEIGLMYLYCNNARFERTLSSSEYVHTELIPDGMKEDEYSIRRLGNLNILPRNEMLDTDFNTECNDTE
jgi:hypothetical protein